MPAIWSTLSPETLLLTALAVFAAYFLKGFSGFGPALVMIPVFSLLFGPARALATATLIDLGVGFVLLATLRYRPGDGRLILRMSLGVALGSVLGASLAGVVPRDVVLAAIGVAVLAMGLLWIVWRSPLPPGIAAAAGSRRLWAGCVLGGFTGGLVGISAPFIVVAARLMLDKDAFRRILVAVFLVEGVVKLAVYRSVGIWSADASALALLVCPAVAAGLLVGARSHLRVGERAFSLVVGVLLSLLGIRVLVAL